MKIATLWQLAQQGSGFWTLASAISLTNQISTDWSRFCTAIIADLILVYGCLVVDFWARRFDAAHVEVLENS